jgi:hypothetical protein
MKEGGKALEELISQCNTANIDFLLRNWNNKQYNEKNKLFFFFMNHLLYLLMRWVGLTTNVKASIIYCLLKGS